MRPATIVLSAVFLLCAGVWLGSSLWSEPGAAPPPPAKVPPGPPPPEPPAAVTPDALRQWIGRLTPGQRRALLRALLSGLQEDLAERRRRAAEARFRQSDTDGDGVLTFEEAWAAGLLQRPGRAPAEPMAPEQRRRGAPPREAPRDRLPRQSGAHLPRSGRQAPSMDARLPQNESEAEVLENWDLLQELEVLAKDAGER